MKNEKTKLIIWAVVALVIGVIIGTFLIAPATTGNANKLLSNKPLTAASTKISEQDPTGNLVAEQTYKDGDDLKLPPPGGSGCGCFMDHACGGCANSCTQSTTYTDGTVIVMSQPCHSNGTFIAARHL